MRFKYLLNYLRTSIIFITVTLALGFFGVPISAAGTASVSVSASAQIVSPGSIFTVNIVVQPDSSLAGAQFNLSFNPSLVTANSVSEGNLLKQNGANTYFVPGRIDNSAGIITGVVGVIIGPGQSVFTSGTLAVITFTAGTRGTSPLSLSNVILGDINGQAILSSIGSGQIYIDRAPILTTIGSKSVTIGQSLTFTISAADPDGDLLTYSASNLPSGAKFSPITRTFSWKPTSGQVGTYPGIHFEVSDGISTNSENITIVVNKRNSR